MVQTRWLLGILGSLLLLTACGASQPGLDDSKGVCAPGQMWDGAQCTGAPEGSSSDGSDQPDGGASTSP